MVQRALGPLALVLLATSAAGDVLVVDDDGGAGVDFLQIADAVLAAASGDTILVKAGTYGFVLVDRPLTIVVEDGATAVAAGIRVEGSPALERVVVRGLDATMVLAPSQPGLGAAQYVPALEIDGCAGLVWIEDGAFGADPSADGAAPAARVAQSSEVVLLRSTFDAPSATAFSWSATSSGLLSAQSSVHAWDCSFAGGSGSYISLGSNASPGAQLLESLLFASGCTFVGGQGVPCAEGSPFTGTGHPAGDGGAGLQLDGGGNAAHSLDSTFQGGLAGPWGGWSTWCNVPSNPGPAISDPASHTFLPGSARELSVSAPVRENGVVDVVLRGDEGDVALAAISLAPAAELVVPVYGSLLVAPSYLVLIAGTIDASGTVGFGIPLGQFAPGVESLSAFVQGVVLSTGGEFRVASGSAAVLLDGQF